MTRLTDREQIERLVGMAPHDRLAKDAELTWQGRVYKLDNPQDCADLIAALQKARAIYVPPQDQETEDNG